MKIQQVGEIALTYKAKVNPNHRLKITSSKEAHNVFLANWSEHIEWIEE